MSSVELANPSVLATVKKLSVWSVKPSTREAPGPDAAIRSWVPVWLWDPFCDEAVPYMTYMAVPSFARSGVFSVYMDGQEASWLVWA